MPLRRPRIRSIRSMTQLTTDPQNANRGTDRGRAALEQSLREYGAGRAVLIDRHGRIIDEFVSEHRGIASARAFVATSVLARRIATEVIADRAAALANVTPDLIPAAFHDTGECESNRCEAGHGSLKAWLRPVRGLRTDRAVSVVIRGRAFVQNVRRGHYELGVEASPVFRLAAAFDELQPAI